MELEFQNQQLTFFKPVICAAESQELVQELRLGDGSPGVKRVIGGWGQCVIRSKEWHSTYISCSGGLMAWVLYEAEDREDLQVISAWLPFQQQWDLPAGTGEGSIRICSLVRFVDARSVTPRKIMIRAGISCYGQAFERQTAFVNVPENSEPEVQMRLKADQPMLCKEAGEKTFSLDEEFSFPESCPAAAALVYCTLTPLAQDRRVLADKLAFRGECRIHSVYLCQDGQLSSCEFTHSFSQFAQLDGIYDNQASGEILLALTGLEPELTESGKLRLKGSMVAQYLICQPEKLELLEDAYSPGRELQLQRETLQLPVVQETLARTHTVEQDITAEAAMIYDAVCLPDFPAIRRSGDQLEVECPGNMQLLYLDRNQQLQTVTGRYSWHDTLPETDNVHAAAISHPSGVQTVVHGDRVEVKTELPVSVSRCAQQEISMITSAQLGEPKPLDPDRPSVILRRCLGETLWDLAKETGTTAAAIAQANQLEGECQSGQLLLIPVP